jgi:alpha-L-arabinofuranosidase
VADNYLWKTHRLDDPKWWPAKQGPQTTDTDEFMALCRQAGAEPIFVANLETGFVHGDVDGGVRMAAEWVEHCNRRNDYNVMLWEIGNETYLYNPGKHKRAKVTPEMYADAYLKYSRAMKVVDPSIRTGAIGPTRKEGWWTVVLPRIKDEVDFVVVHEYFKSSWGAPGGRAEAIGRFRDYVRHVVPDRAVPIALTEWNTNKATEGSEFAQAIMVSEMALDYIAGGVDWATFWPLRIGGKDWGTRALLDMETNEPRLRYRAFQLLSSNMGARQIETRLKGAALYAFASRDEAGKEIQAFFVNRSTQDDATELTIRIEGTAPKRASAQALTAPSLDASEAAVAPVAIAAKDGAWTCVLPPHSLTVVRFD